jgi:hypothetical protein
MEQLALLEQPPAAPKLTDRQAFVLELVTQAGADGVHADEVGAALDARRGKHPRDVRCQWCGRNGQQMLESLKKKGLVRYRRGNRDRPGFWQLPGAAEPRRSSVPYNDFPEGY